MATTNISFNGNSLQTSNILVSDIDHFDIPTKDATMYPLAHALGSAIPYVNYPSRAVAVSGMIYGSSVSDLDSRIDAFKYALSGTNKNLDIDYAGSTRRYIATLTRTGLSRPGGLLHAKFTLQFECPSPFGSDTGSTTALNSSGRTSASYLDSYTFLGTAPFQIPIATITLGSFASSSTNLCTNPGFETDVSGWTTQGYGGSFSRVTTQHNSGVASMQIVNAATATFGFYGGVQYQMTGLTVGQTYSIILYMKGNAGGEAVQISTNGGAIQSLTLTTGWVAYSILFAAGASTAYIYISGAAASSTYFLDDVSITANNAASMTWGNGGTGQTITLTRTWSAGDIVVIDGTQKTVTVNGSPINFLGAFPEFPPGSQTIQYSDTFVSRSMTELVTYTAAYL
jgi:hypothetical protein